eukprot:6174942-Pleurochrysis_carterae.AAC.1
MLCRTLLGSLNASACSRVANLANWGDRKAVLQINAWLQGCVCDIVDRKDIDTSPWGIRATQHMAGEK